MKNTSKTELLAPAGTLEKLKWACQYGADAVYFGLEFGSLRSYAGNFTLQEAAEGLKYLHERDKKGYVTLNIYPFSDEYGRLTEMAGQVDDMGADAIIVADLGVLTALKRMGLRARLHVSTQANTTSWQTVLAYRELGAARVNLARELSLEQIREIQQNTAGSIETEVFVHGAVCFSYSGRCAISDYLAGARANRGQCKHPCRWKYFVVEEERPGQYMPVFEDERGLYLFNSKELALWEYVPLLCEAGVSSFKIEGRMKSVHYLASIVSFYRQVMDGRLFSKDEADTLLGRVPNRGYSTGFMKGGVGPDDYSTAKSLSEAESIFVGAVRQSTGAGSMVEVRNKIFASDVLETLSPDDRIGKLTMPSPLPNAEGLFANHGEILPIPESLPEYTILRRIKSL
ncbi:MAG: U32 family peptidase [Planctomycetaceae bacterium]|nr:U32 family peptidase [Planctomycetaceae bacterium]